MTSPECFRIHFRKENISTLHRVGRLIHKNAHIVQGIRFSHSRDSLAVPFPSPSADSEMKDIEVGSRQNVLLESNNRDPGHDEEDIFSESIDYSNPTSRTKSTDYGMFYTRMALSEDSDYGDIKSTNVHILHEYHSMPPQVYKQFKQATMFVLFKLSFSENYHW